MPQNKEQKAINNIYALLCVSLLMGFIPIMTAALLALLMFTGALIGAYVIRSKADEHSLAANHMTFIIRTIWIASLFALISTAIASAYLLPNYDNSMLMACADQVVQNLGSGMTDPVLLEEKLKPCMDDFMQANKSVFIIATIIAATPIVVYMGYRLAKGLSRAVKGHRIGDVKAWF